jgi:hypothetical protein
MITKVIEYGRNFGVTWDAGRVDQGMIMRCIQL